MRFSNGSATLNTVAGNLIGTDADGEDTLDNGWAGVFIEDAPNNSIGGATADHGNLISGFDYGIVLDNADGTDIFSNLIGTNLDGTAALAGNLWAGIELSLSSGVSIGGVGQGNVIGGFGDGIDLLGSGTTATTIQGNFIGTNSAGTADLGNDYDGIYVEGSSNNTIGGANPGEGNLIRFNDEAGVYVYSGTGNAIRGNAIDGNSDGGATALGIDLRTLGVTANDTGDADTGANNRQNFPVLTASESSPAATSVTGTLNSTASTSNILIDFYASPSCDPSGNGEGAIYLGSTTVSTDGSGNATINVSTLAGLPDDDALQITATATASGNSSEFSACVTAAYTPGEPSGWDGTADWHYTYDGLDRLTYACDAWNGTSCDGSEWTYTYDGAGNLTRFDKWDGAEIETVAYIYNGANQIQCIDTNADSSCEGEFNYSYDDFGNLLNDGVSIYTYDAAMRLKAVSSGGILTTYTYNGDGDRVSQTVEDVTTVTTTYTLDVATPLTMVLAEVSPTETVYYLHGLGLVAESSSVDGLRYFGVDGLGSVRQLTDEDGDVLLAQSFDPYGSPYQRAGADVTSYGWAGEQADENGLIYLRARFYAPAMGRFLNTDPSRMELNPYQYSAGNPINFTDPSGLFLCEEILDPYADLATRMLCEGLEYVVVIDAYATGQLSAESFAAVQVQLNPAIETLSSGQLFLRFCLKVATIVLPLSLCGSTDATACGSELSPAWPYPQAQSLPLRQPVTSITSQPWPQPLQDRPTPTVQVQVRDDNSVYHVVLGLERSLNQMPMLKFFQSNLQTMYGTIHVYSFDDWYPTLTSVSKEAWRQDGSLFNQAFDEATSRAVASGGRIHFSLDGIGDPVGFASSYGGDGVFPPSAEERWTAIELHRIMNNPELCARTVFYRHASLPLQALPLQGKGMYASLEDHTLICGGG